MNCIADMGIKDDREMQNDYQASKHILTSFDRLSPTIMNKKYSVENELLELIIINRFDNTELCQDEKVRQ